MASTTTKEKLKRILILFHNIVCLAAILITASLALYHIKEILNLSTTLYVIVELLLSVPLAFIALFSKEFKLARLTYPLFYIVIFFFLGDQDDTNYTSEQKSSVVPFLFLFPALGCYAAFLVTFFESTPWYPIVWLAGYCLLTKGFLAAVLKNREIIL